MRAVGFWNLVRRPRAAGTLMGRARAVVGPAEVLAAPLAAGVFVVSATAMVASVFAGRPPLHSIPLLASLPLLRGISLRGPLVLKDGLPLPGLLAPAPHPIGDLGFFDLRVYRRAAEIVGGGGSLYTAKFRHGLGFTYPPFAALLFLPLRALSLRGDELAVTLLNLALGALVVHASLALADPSGSNRRRLGRASHERRRAWLRSAAAWLAAAAAIWSEPFRTTIGYGQIDLLVAALVVVDLAYLPRSRLGGLGVGLAAALKLTPLVFIPYLLLSARRGMAARAGAVFAGSVALAFLTLPRDARRYWLGGAFMKVSRVTGGSRLAGSGAANQSLRGALMRLAPGLAHLTLVWLALALLLGVAGVLLAARAARRSQEAWGFALAAVTGLLISPVSWTHHWAIGVAATVALAGASRRTVTAVGTGVALAIGWVSANAIWRVIALGPGAPLTARELVLGDLYVLLGLAIILAAATIEVRLALGSRSRRRAAAALLPTAGSLETS